MAKKNKEEIPAVEGAADGSAPAESPVKKGFAIPGLDAAGTKLLIMVFAVSLLLSLGSVVAISQLRGKGLAHKAGADIKAGTEAMREGMKEGLGGVPDGEKLSELDIEAHRLALDAGRDIPLRQRIEHLRRILSASPDDRAMAIELGTGLIAYGSYDSAALIFGDLHAASTGDSLDRIIAARFGLALYLAGRRDEGSREIDTCVQLYPTLAEGWCYRGEIEMANNLASDSIEFCFRKALECDPQYPEGLYQLARYYLVKPRPGRSDMQSAKITLEHLLALEPLNAKALGRMGMCCHYLNRTDEARKYYLAALSINPDDYNTRYNLGILLLDRCNDEAGALIQFLEAIRIRPDHVHANFRTGLMSLSNNMDKEAIQYFQKALAVEPRNIRILMQLAVAYEKLAMKADAQAIYRSILTIDIKNDIAMHKLRMLEENK